MLVGDGLIETRAGLGTFVTERGSVVSGNGGPPLDRAQIEELIEARLVLETELSALAATRASAAESRSCGGSWLAWTQPAVDPGRFLDADVSFHLALARSTHNRFLSRALRAA